MTNWSVLAERAGPVQPPLLSHGRSRRSFWKRPSSGSCCWAATGCRLGFALPLLGAVAARLYPGLRRRRDGLPFAMAVVIFVCAFAMAGSFWRHVTPLSVAIADAASPASSLRFLYGSGLVVIPVIIVYTACVYRIFRGKVRAEMLYD